MLIESALCNSRDNRSIRDFCKAPGRPRGWKWHKNEAAGKSPPLVRCHRKVAAYLHAGAPTETTGVNASVLSTIAHFTSGVVRLLFVIVTAQPPLPAARPT